MPFDSGSTESASDALSFPLNRRVIRGALMPYLLTLMLLLFAIEDAQAQKCKPGDVLVGEDADNYYCMERAQYEGSAAQRLGLQFCRAKPAVAADHNAIRELGFATDAERFELFANVAKEQKAELQHKVFDALFDQGLDAIETVFKS